MIIPEISVVVPLYNKQDTISFCIQSVIEQTTRPLEIVVVNDGSTDNSVLKLNQIFLPDYVELKLINVLGNRGVSYARNLGVQRANGELIAFLDADDYWEKNFLEEMSLAFCEVNADILGSGYYFIGSNDNKRVANLKTNYNSLVQIKDYFEFSTGYDLPFTSSSVLLSKSSFYQLGMFDESLTMGEDQVLWNNYVVQGLRCFSFNKSLSNYVINNGSSACNNVLKTKSWQFAEIVMTDSIMFSSSYKTKFLNNTILKAFFYAVLYKSYDDMEKALNSPAIRSNFYKLIMKIIIKINLEITSRIFGFLYVLLSKRSTSTVIK